MLSSLPRPGQATWVLVLTLLAESAWIHAAVGLFFLGISADAAPSWISTILAISCSALVWRLLLRVGAPLSVDIPLAITLGILVTYLIVAFQISDTRWFDAAWPAHAAKAAYQADAQDYFNGALGEVFLALMLWWRGIRLAGTDDPQNSLLTTFKVGLVMISLVVVVGVINSANVDALPMMAIFTASSLAGFWIYYLLPGSGKIQRLGDWSKIIGPVVAAVLAVSIGFGYIIDALFPAAKLLLRPLGSMMLFLFDLLLAPILMGLAFAATLFWEFLYGIFGTPSSSISETPPQYVEEIREAAELKSLPAYAEVFLWLVAIAIIGLAFYVLARTIRRSERGTKRPSEGEHESMADGADPLGDIARLLLGMLPDSWRKPQARTFRLPNDDPGVLEVLQIYYDLLYAAEDRGVVRSPGETPTEFREKLEKVFPARLVHLATEAFVLVCYGRHTPSASRLSALRLQVRPDAGPNEG
jgi:hypothetical protein